MNREPRPLAELLRELREQRGASLRAVARALDVDAAYLSRVETGKRTASPSLLRRASSYYDVSEEDLAVAAGDIPVDVVQILRAHPEAIERLRREYGSE